MPLGLEGKHAVVCGATQGIGLAAAQHLAGLGARVTLLARNAERLEEARRSLSQPERHMTAQADFSRPQEVKAAIEAVVNEHPVHILVNNTGGPAGGPIVEAEVDAFINTFQQHLICNQLLAQAVLTGMKDAGYGRIINVISTSVKQPLTNLGVSNTIRGAVANWAKTWANEVGVHGITVNNVLPGATNTARLEQIIANKADKIDASTGEIHAQMAAAVPLKRTGEPEEVGRAIAFLASPSASYISGINLPVDGGRTSSL
ncbi:MAG: short-chain dehydrogenase [Flavobacteriales bacterium]|nr:short-chain dehydrogenase [Flavobacteriales bacterium]